MSRQTGFAGAALTFGSIAAAVWIGYVISHTQGDPFVDTIAFSIPFIVATLVCMGGYIASDS